MKRISLYVALALLVLGTAVVAQTPPAPGSHSGLWVGMFNTAAGRNHVMQLDSQNNATAFTTAPNSPWPYWGNPFGACMYKDNDKIVVPGIVDAGATAINISLWDPNLPGVAVTLWAGALGPSGPLQNWADWEMNPDGEIITIDNSVTPQTMNFFDPNTGAWNGGANQPYKFATTVVDAMGIGATKYQQVGPSAGKYRHCGWGQSRPPTTLYETTYDGSSTTVVAKATGFVGRYGGDFDEEGNFFSSTCCSNVYQYNAAGSSQILPGPAGPSMYDITAEHYAKPGKGLWGTLFASPRGVAHIDVSGGPTSPVITTIYTGTAQTMPASAIEVVEIYSNDLNTSRKQGQNLQWDININPGNATHAGQQYVIGASLAGQTKIPLADGRELFITPDGLTITMSGLGWQLPPFLTGTAGTLDPFGKATGTINLSSLAGLSVLNGTPVFLAGLVLDSQAPSGVGHVFQPWTFVINGL